MRHGAIVLVAAALTACGASAPAGGTAARSSHTAAPSGKLAIAREQPGHDTAVVRLTDAEGGNAQRLETYGSLESRGSAIWSPDGGSILLTNIIRFDGDGTLLPFRPAIVSEDGSGYRRLQVPDGPFDMFCDLWSPDGARVLCMFGGPSGGVFSIQASDGSDPIRITRNPFDGGMDHPGSFSPDGTQLVFMRARPASGTHDAGGALFVKDIGSGATRRITPYGLPQWEEYGWAVHWSPDGKDILFASVEGAHGYRGRLYLIHPDGTGLRGVHLDTDGRPYSAWAPDWSPDGSRIVFRMTEGQMDIYTADPDGTDIVQVTDTPAPENSADWAA